MGAVSDQMLESGFDRIQDVHGRRMQVLSAGPNQGQAFTATLLVAASLDLQDEFGIDRREKTTAHFPKSAFPVLAINDQLKDDDGQVWYVVQRTNNPTDNTVDYEIAIKDPALDK